MIAIHMADAAEVTRKASEQIASAANSTAENATLQNESAIAIQQQTVNNINKTEQGFEKANKMLKATKNSANFAANARNRMQVMIEEFSDVNATVDVATQSVLFSFLYR